MKIRRRYPNFFSGFEETEHEVNSLEELKNISWIKDMEDIEGHIGIFYSPNEYDGPDYLMALCEGDDRPLHFVVGYIYGNGKELGLKDYHKYIK